VRAEYAREEAYLDSVLDEDGAVECYALLQRFFAAAAASSSDVVVWWEYR
jgi:hypothetical protein